MNFFDRHKRNGSSFELTNDDEVYTAVSDQAEEVRLQCSRALTVKQQLKQQSLLPDVATQIEKLTWAVQTSNTLCTDLNEINQNKYLDLQQNQIPQTPITTTATEDNEEAQSNRFGCGVF